MRVRPRVLINTPAIELWPADLLQARRNAHARVLARADWVLRRKRDGRYLAALARGQAMPLAPHWERAEGVDAALLALASSRTGWLPLERLRERLHELGLDDGYAERTGLPLVPEPTALAFAGFDRYRRPLWLSFDAASAWRRMQVAARSEGIVLEAISGYRSHDYQLGIFRRKRARGLSVEDILAVNAAPGYSEHHSGDALDIGTPDEAPAEESFEKTAAFAWLQRRAGDFGFVLSYPRENPHGIVYEPWHWCLRSGSPGPAEG